MDLTSIQQLKEKGASVLVVLEQTLYRGVSSWNITASFECVPVSGATPVPYTVNVSSHRSYHTAKRRLEMASIAFVEKSLDADQGKSSRALSLSGQRPTSTPKTCALCSKTNFDDSKGCFNASVFSPCVGDWLCNWELCQ